MRAEEVPVKYDEFRSNPNGTRIPANVGYRAKNIIAGRLSFRPHTHAFGGVQAPTYTAWKCYTFFMEYRRVFIPGGTYFFTVVTFDRRPIFSSSKAVKLLRQSFLYTAERFPYKIIAIVIMPDHLHVIWTLPPESSDFSIRWRLIKSHFARNWRKSGSGMMISPRNEKGEVDVWQRRFWEHLIRDEEDLNNHIDYIHYNPVKHGLVSLPEDWQYSSFMKFVEKGYYPPDWSSKAKIFLCDPRMEWVHVGWDESGRGF
jgi:putative transposase